MSGLDAYGNPRRRRLLVGPGILALAVVLPFVLWEWAPAWFVVTWSVSYAAIGLYGVSNPFRQPWPTIDLIWSHLVAVCFAALPVASAVWRDEPSAIWQVAVISTAYVAIETAMLPHLELAEWRVPPVLVTVVQTVVIFWSGAIIVGLLYGGAMAAVLFHGHQSRSHSLFLIARRREAETETAKARHLARHDALTGVLNRRGITQEIEALVRAPATIVMFDANRFKSINDTAGHAVGDRVLVEIAAELERRLDDNWKIGRLGGDEFVAVAAGAEHVPLSVADPVTCHIDSGAHEQRLEVGLSAGVVSTKEPSTVDHVLTRASYAVRDAKRRRAGLARFGGKLRRRFERGLEVAAALTGSSDGQIVSHAQCIVHEGRIIGCELLARWQRPNGSLVSPVEFLPLLRDNALVPELNRHMIDEGVRYAARFNNRPAGPFVSVNVSAPHLASPDIVNEVRTALDRHRVSPERLMIEVTESDALWRGGWQRSARKLREMGVLLAIDDFGAGYSTIERVAAVPISHLKFDRAFATRVSSPFGEVMRGIVRFADSSGIGVIAEGIETHDQQLAMESVGITKLQGFLFGRPAPLDEIERLMIEGLAADAGVADDSVDVTE